MKTENFKWICANCNSPFELSDPFHFVNSDRYCNKCYHSFVKNKMPTIPVIKVFNEPPHYHKYEIDTIEFLQKGFPPDVFKGFAIGSIVKYLHRHTEKGGLEDLLKAEDYAKRLYEFEKETGGK